jgi:hypothetical protein
MATPDAPYLAKMTYDHYVGLRGAAQRAYDEIEPMQDLHNVYSELGDLRALAAMGTGFYDMAHAHLLVEKPRHMNAHRSDAGTINTELQMWMKVADTAIDKPAPGRDDEQIAAFLGNAKIALLSGQERPPVGGWHRDLQIATTGMGVYLNARLGLASPEDATRKSLDKVLTGAATVAVRQKQLTDPMELVGYSKMLGEACGEVAAISAEHVDDASYPLVRAAARDFGSGSIVLDHWSDVVHDLREGANTFATAYVKQYGVSGPRLKELRDLALSTSEADYRRGMYMLDPGKPRGVYRTLQWLVWNFNMKKKSSSITESNVEAALIQGPN